jgi:hypothetical protein
MPVDRRIDAIVPPVGTVNIEDDMWKAPKLEAAYRRR